MSMPDVHSAKLLRERPLDPAHVALLFTDIVSGDGIEYAHLLAIFRKGTKAPIAVVSAERAVPDAKLLAELGLDLNDVGPADGSHFLCIFYDGQHMNFGARDKWAEIAEFETEALAVLSRLGVLSE